MYALDLVRLTPLMDRTAGRPEVVIGLIDGPVALDHAALAGQRIRKVSETTHAACALTNSVACMHGTFVAGILCARRGSVAPAICPESTLLLRPIFTERSQPGGQLPSATPEELAAAIVETVDSGARLLNISAALTQPATRSEGGLERALDYAASRGVIVVAAAGNQGGMGSTAITRHPWVIPVAACDAQGRPMNESNLGSSIGRRGLSAPGDGITSLGTDGKPRSFGGTSAATPFVSGSIALIWSEFPDLSARDVKLAVMRSGQQRRRSVVPPLLDAWAAYQALASTHRGRTAA
jgi:subtilisin family serine protease